MHLGPRARGVRDNRTADRNHPVAGIAMLLGKGAARHRARLALSYVANTRSDRRPFQRQAAGFAEMAGFSSLLEKTPISGYRLPAPAVFEGQRPVGVRLRDIGLRP